MKRFLIPRITHGTKHDVEIYIGAPSPLRNPVYYQCRWWQRFHEGAFERDIEADFLHIFNQARRGKKNFEALCVQVLSPIRAGAIREREGNVILADFSRIKPQPVPPDNLFTADIRLDDTRFFDCFPIKGQDVRLLCHRLSVEITPYHLRYQEWIYARHLLEGFLILLTCVTEAPESCVPRMRVYMRPSITENQLFNIAASLDCIGYWLTFYGLSALEFFAASTTPQQRRIIGILRKAIKDWAAAPTGKKTVTAFSEFALSAADIKHLKKTLATAMQAR